MVGKANYADTNMGFLLGKRVRCKRADSGLFTCSAYKVLSPALQLRSMTTTLTMRAVQLGICMQDVGVSFSKKENWRSKNWLKESKKWAKAAESILAASPNGLPPVANQCKSSTTHAWYQEVDSKTLTANVMAMA